MGPRQAGQSEVGSPEGRVTFTPVPAAAEGKHLQEKGELDGRNEGKEGRSLVGHSENLHSVSHPAPEGSCPVVPAVQSQIGKKSPS